MSADDWDAKTPATPTIARAWASADVASAVYLERIVELHHTQGRNVEPSDVNRLHKLTKEAEHYRQLAEKWGRY